MQQSVGARVDQIYKVEMADLQGHFQEILSRSSYVEFAGTRRHKHLAPKCHVEDLCPVAGVEG